MGFPALYFLMGFPALYFLEGFPGLYFLKGPVFPEGPCISWYLGRSTRASGGRNSQRPVFNQSCN